MIISYRLVLIVATLGLVGLGAAQSPPNAKPSFTVTISMPQDVVKLGSPIELQLTVTNISDHDLSCGIGTVNGKIRRRIDVKVYDSTGKPVPETELGMTIHGRPPHGLPFGGAGFADHISKGESFHEKSDLNQEFILTKPGKYTVQAERHDFDNKVLVKSNTLTFTLTGETK